MFQTIYNLADPLPVIKDKDSIVVPDMAFTPREILSKFSRGERVPLGFEGLYDSEDDGDALDSYDRETWEDDPTRDPSFDFGDYVEEKHALKQREAERRAKRNNAAKGSAAGDPKRKASSEELSASDPTRKETTSVGAPAVPPTVE